MIDRGSIPNGGGWATIPCVHAHTHAPYCKIESIERVPLLRLLLSPAPPTEAAQQCWRRAAGQMER